MKTQRLLFFALETILLTVAALDAAGIIFHRTIDEPIVASIIVDLFMVSFLGLLFWWAAYRTKHTRLGRFAFLTLVCVISPIVTTAQAPLFLVVITWTAILLLWLRHP